MADEIEFEVDLVFALPDGVGDEALLLDALFEAGCNDVVVGLGTPCRRSASLWGRDPELAEDLDQLTTFVMGVVDVNWFMKYLPFRVLSSNR